MAISDVEKVAYSPRSVDDTSGYSHHSVVYGIFLYRRTIRASWMSI